jgi:hypothetical protein
MNEEEKESNTKKEKDEVQVTVSIEHERKLQKMLNQVSDGFDMARVTRKQILAHVIDKIFEAFNDDDIQAVRKSTLTDMSLLEFEIREIRKTGIVPDALREYLWKSRNLTQSPKRAKKSRQAEYSNAISEDGEAA